MGRIGPFGFAEILIIAVVVLLLFGPKRLPEMARGLSQALREFRRGLNEVTRDIQDGLNEAGEQEARPARPAHADSSAAGADGPAVSPPPAAVPETLAPEEETQPRS